MGVSEVFSGGEGGIRTRGGLATSTAFKAAGFNHSPTSPISKINKFYRWMVPGAGLEPAREKLPRDFKSLASTNSATRAWK